MSILVWFRNNLRLHDHEPLHLALQTKQQVICVYCFDLRCFGQTSFGFPKTGPFRAQFILASVLELRQQLQSRGSDLVVRVGKPEVILPDLAQQYGVEQIFYQRQVTAEERVVEKSLERSPIPCRSFQDQTLLAVEDLPFKVVPEVFTSFRKAVEEDWLVREPYPTPAALPALPEGLVPGPIPTLEELGLEAAPADPRAVLQFQGGELQGLARLDDYFWRGDHLRVYKQTRNQMLGANHSSKFSPWLALGCLSPRYIYAQVKKYESDRIANDSTYWLVFELLWRDYFHLIAAKHGNKIFQPQGLRGISIPWRQDTNLFQAWQNGTTGYPLVDANMRELAATGFMSNRGRQNVASFLTKNLGIDWRMGAEWFESLLIDYDPCSNWGNWNYTAGVGNDARGFRFFNITKQAKDYDPEGKYVKHWLPELAKVPISKIHEPWKLTAQERSLVQGYPPPVVDLLASAAANEKIYNQALGRRR